MKFLGVWLVERDSHFKPEIAHSAVSFCGQAAECDRRMPLFVQNDVVLVKWCYSAVMNSAARPQIRNRRILAESSFFIRRFNPRPGRRFETAESWSFRPDSIGGRFMTAVLTAVPRTAPWLKSAVSFCGQAADLKPPISNRELSVHFTTAHS